MAYVRDNLPRGTYTGLKGAMGTATSAGGNAVFDTGLSVIHHVTWYDTNQGTGGGYDFDNSTKRPPYNDTYFNIPTVSNGVITLTGNLIQTGDTVEFWAVGE